MEIMFANKLHIVGMDIQVFPPLYGQVGADIRSPGIPQTWVITSLTCCVCTRSLETDKEYLKSSLSIGNLGRQNGASEDEWTRLG